MEERLKFVEPKVRLTGRMHPEPEQIREWLIEDLGCIEQVAEFYAYNTTKTAGEILVELAGRRCYNSFQEGLNPNVTRIRKDIQEYIDNILKSGHGSILEHVYYRFNIENVSRVFTGEMNRHRAGVAISEASMRYIRYTNIPFVRTPLLTMTEEDYRDADVQKYLKWTPDAYRTELKSISYKKLRTIEMFTEIVESVEKAYEELCTLWADELSPKSSFHWKKHLTSLLRRIMPMGISTGGVWTANLRALRHICTMRCSEAAEEEIQLVANQILGIMRKEEPLFFGDFKQDERGFWAPGHVKV
jgi:thymidylate synthase (FAD)